MSRRILVVGGSSGIGWETVRRLVAAGDEVMVATRRGEALNGFGVKLLPLDLDSTVGMEFPQVLDGFVYCPGTITLKPFHRLTDDDFLEDYRVNVLGAVRCLRAALPALKASGRGSVVLFSSVVVAQGMPFHASIAAAKGAVEALGKSLAAELAPAIRVNIIAPSLTDTRLAEGLLNSDAKRDAAAKRHPMQRVGDPAHVAGLVDFLLSDAASSMTGQVLRPDGGLSSVRTF